MTDPQVEKDHYSLDTYIDEDRFVSYYWQLKETLSRNPASILEVGVGDKVLGNFLRSNTAVSYTSLDIAEDLGPDVLGSVTELPFPDSHVDMACAFEVLEHLPFEEFDRSLGELARVARTYVVISLPHFGPMLSFSCKIPFLPRIRLAWKVPYPKTHIFNGQHYWEIGKRGYPVSRIRTMLRTHGTLITDFVPFNSSYHHFFVLDCSRPTL